MTDTITDKEIEAWNNLFKEPDWHLKINQTEASLIFLGLNLALRRSRKNEKILREALEDAVHRIDHGTFHRGCMNTVRAALEETKNE